MKEMISDDILYLIGHMWLMVSFLLEDVVGSLLTMILGILILILTKVYEGGNRNKRYRIS